MSRLEVRELVASWVQQPDPVWIEEFHNLRKTRRLSEVVRTINEMLELPDDGPLAHQALSRARRFTRASLLSSKGWRPHHADQTYYCLP